VDQEVIDGLDPTFFTLKAFVLRPDFPAGTHEVHGKASHISLCDAYPVLCEQLRGADILCVNGSFDPVASNAAATVGVSCIVEIMHQVETGGMHKDIDIVVCVSELVRSAQIHEHTVVIHNGIDTDRFSFKPGSHGHNGIHVIQVANAAKRLHRELEDIAAQISDPRLHPVMVGDRPSRPGSSSLGVIEDMPSVYHKADLLFLIEHRSAFGLVFAEAMACGTLPIVSGDSGAVAFVHPKKTGWVVNPASPTDAADKLREAADCVGSPQFLAMQRQARALIERDFSKERMLLDYQKLYAALGRRPKKKPGQAEAWMDLMLFIQLFQSKNTGALSALERYLADPRPLEPYFLRHPTGQAALQLVLLIACPSLLETGYAPLVSVLCRRLRRSRCVSPFLDNIERVAGDRSHFGKM
jgi:hypothetical protein